MQLWLCLKIFFKRKKRKPITPTHKLFKKPPLKQSTSSHRPGAVPASHSGRVWDPGSAKQGLAQPMRTARPGHSWRRCCRRRSPAADLQTSTQSPTSSCAAFTSQMRRDVQLCKVQINRAAKQQLFQRFQPFNSWLCTNPCGYVKSLAFLSWGQYHLHQLSRLAFRDGEGREAADVAIYPPLHPNGYWLQEMTQADPCWSLPAAGTCTLAGGKEQLIPPGCPALPPLAGATPGCCSANSRAHKIIIAWHLSPTVLNIPSQVKSQFTLLWGTCISVHSWYSGKKKTQSREDYIIFIFHRIKDTSSWFLSSPRPIRAVFGSPSLSAMLSVCPVHQAGCNGGVNCNYSGS